MSFLCISVRFLDERYHGQLERGGPPEWPPSPYRLFQALLAGVARTGGLVSGEDVPENGAYAAPGEALKWLQGLEAPVIIAPEARTGQRIIRYVPNNDADAPGSLERQKRLAAKTVIPTLLMAPGGELPAVHYLWAVESAEWCPLAALREAARSLTTLGWGVDMAFADARMISDREAAGIEGVRWYPSAGDGRLEESLRVPTVDGAFSTLGDLRSCHRSFLLRVQPGRPLALVEEPKIFKRVVYTGPARPGGRPNAIFRLVNEDGDAWRYPHSQLIHVAGRLRCQAIKTAQDLGLDGGEICTLVRGKQDGSGDGAHAQFSYVPLPSIGHEHADAMVRNVMILAPPGREEKLERLCERLNGRRLCADPAARGAGSGGENAAPVLERQRVTAGGFIATCYLGASRVWRTVTPVVLDGHNRKSKSESAESVARTTLGLLRKALARAGVQTACEMSWQAEPFFKNTLSAFTHSRDRRLSGYIRPKHLIGLTAVHVELRFEAPVRGPLTIGAGRHCGLGLFAAVG